MSTTVNEKSPLCVSIAFKDEDGDALTPYSVEWRLDDLETDTEIVDWTALVSPASTMEVIILASNNLIVDETNVREARMFGVRINEGLDSEAHQEFKYHVINLKGATGV